MEPESACASSAPPDEGGVRVRRLEVSYRRGIRRRPALREVTFRAGPGVVTAVLGPNGAGKTTLFRVLLGFLPPDAGEVMVDGLPPGRHRRLRGIGYLPERGSLPRGWTVDGFLRRGLRLSGTGPDGPATSLERARRDAGLDDRGGEHLSTLSLGLVRRAMLAFALLGAPGLLLLDEPLNGLDPPSRSALLGRIGRLRGGRATVLLASHDLDAVARVADRAVVLDRGRLTLTLEELDRVQAARSRLREAFAGPERAR